jgi:hypothetical protein
VSVSLTKWSRKVGSGLPAYTSLLAACYKVCTRWTHISFGSEKAGESWLEKNGRRCALWGWLMSWRTARFRLCAAGTTRKGPQYPGRNGTDASQTILFASVVPSRPWHGVTPLLFGTNKDRARIVAASFLTTHHGKMARTLVIMAENAEVNQDRGFVAALTACAAAGDVAGESNLCGESSATVDQLRTVGPNSHLARLRGQPAPMDSLEDELRPQSVPC